jgi:hypothetical protein
MNEKCGVLSSTRLKFLGSDKRSSLLSPEPMRTLIVKHLAMMSRARGAMTTTSKHETLRNPHDIAPLSLE